MWYKSLLDPEEVMIWDKKESWMELCELAAQEKDPAKLMTLIGEITRLLESKEQRVKKVPGSIGELFDTVHTVLCARKRRAILELRFAVNLSGHGLASDSCSTFRPSRPLPEKIPARARELLFHRKPKPDLK